MKLGIVGATGLVGQNFLKLLAASETAISELRLFSRSQKEVNFKEETLKTHPLEKGVFRGLDICFFSAGKEVSQKWAGQAVSEEVIVIDNSSAFRRAPDIPLIVPEVNGHLLKYEPQIIANPNCSTIQLVSAMNPIHKAFGLQTLRVVSLQAVSGAGREALEKLKKESLDILKGTLPYENENLSLAFNCIPHIGKVSEQGFAEEEEKIIFETKKIMSLPHLKVAAFTLRVPAFNSHGEVVWFSLDSSPSNEEVLGAVYRERPEIVWEKHSFPHGRKASGKEEVFVGRIHKDPVSENSWIMWVVADNLLKGAALNGWQIAKKLWKIKS